MFRKEPRTIIDSWRPFKVKWYDRFRYVKGDRWEVRINEWGVWEEDVLEAYVWNGTDWDQIQKRREYV